MEKRIQNRPSKDGDEPFERSEQTQQATYDYKPVVRSVLNGGGDVFICNLRIKDRFTCPWCGTDIDDKRHVVCPCCKKGLKRWRKN